MEQAAILKGHANRFDLQGGAELWVVKRPALYGERIDSKPVLQRRSRSAENGELSACLANAD